MTRTSQNGGPPCPRPQRVRELIDYFSNLEEVVIGDTKNKEVSASFRDLTDALDWLATSLENRSLYHKKQSLKNKHLRALAKEYGLDDQANVMTRESLHAFVSNQPPEKEEIDIEFPPQGDNNE
jgi:hypothetical protein